MLKLGKTYTRDEIHRVCGGSKQSFLPTVNDRVVCVCVSRQLNKDAPGIILGGTGPQRETAADLLANDATNVIPVFIKESTNNWRYEGSYRCRQAVKTPSAVARYANASGRSAADVYVVLKMEKRPESEMRRVDNVCICYGDSSHLQQLRSLAQSRKRDTWTVPKHVAKGDLAIFYIIRPHSSFVATGRVLSTAFKVLDKRDHWHGKYMASVGEIKLLDSPIPVQVARDEIPHWGWLRAPRRALIVPRQHVARLLELLNTSPSKPLHASESDLEGLKYEVRQMKSKRSQRLRQEAFDRANGICGVCDCDFSMILGGRGVRVLQVHHKKQLSATKFPRRTNLNDLAVVCANCHMLLHLDSKSPLPLNILRDLLRSTATT